MIRKQAFWPSSIVVLIILIFTWLTWPSPNQIDPLACKPNGFLAEISEKLHGARFWQDQLKLVQEKISEASDFDRSTAEFNASMRSFHREIDAMGKEWKSASQQLADRLRRQADEIEELEFQRQMSADMKMNLVSYKKCENFARSKIN